MWCIFNNCRVYNQSHGEGVIISVTPTQDCDYYINVNFIEEHNEEPICYLASVAIKEKKLVFYTGELRTNMALLLSEIESDKRSSNINKKGKS